MLPELQEQYLSILRKYLADPSTACLSDRGVIVIMRDAANRRPYFEALSNTIHENGMREIREGRK